LCDFCRKSLFALCDESNPNHEAAEKIYGDSPAGLFGYSHLYGGFAGGQAEYLRVPFADVGPLRIPEHLPDEKVLFLSDIFPTGYMAAENCSIQPGDTVAVWGCGPVGQFAIRCALLLGAGSAIAIDNIAERLELAARAGAVTIDFQGEDDRNLFDHLKDLTDGRGPHACIDAVGMEAHGASPGEIYDWVKMGLRLATDRPNVLRQTLQACRKGVTVSVAGVYAGFLDKIPFGAAVAKGLTIKTGQTHVQRYMAPLLEIVESGKLDPSFVITHELPLDAGAEAYETFKQHRDGCIKVVLKPGEQVARGKVQEFAGEEKPAGHREPAVV
jgi:threonine dehydrogenase-like Zn-dependent dehydrogenase